MTGNPNDGHPPGDDPGAASFTTALVSLAPHRRRFWRTELVALAVAFVASIGLIVLAVTAPFYSSSVSEQTSTGTVINHPSTSATLLDVNGPSVLFIMGVPLLMTVSLIGILWTRGIDRGPGTAAWTLVGLLGALTLAGMLTIGPTLFPVAAGLMIACGIRQARQSPRLTI